MIFDFVIVTRLTQKDKVESKLEEIVYGPETMPAHDKRSAELKATKEYAQFDADTMEVIVRPFVD